VRQGFERCLAAGRSSRVLGGGLLFGSHSEAGWKLVRPDMDVLRAAEGGAGLGARQHEVPDGQPGDEPGDAGSGHVASGAAREGPGELRDHRGDVLLAKPGQSLHAAGDAHLERVLSA